MFIPHFSFSVFIANLPGNITCTVFIFDKFREIPASLSAVEGRFTSISVSYTSKGEKDYRKIDRITDVISFAFEDYEDIEYNDIRMLGDIYICIPQMKRQAEEYGHSEKRELSFLAVHGLLHLLGYDHMEPEDEKEMFDLQNKLLDGYNIKR